MSDAEQKQAIGERLFPLIQARHGERAGKITGMLLEMDNSELLHMLDVMNIHPPFRFSPPTGPAGPAHQGNRGTQGAGGAREERHPLVVGSRSFTVKPQI